MLTKPDYIIQRGLYPDKLRQPIENPNTGQISIIGQILIQLKQSTKGVNDKAVYLLSDIPGIQAIPPFTMPCNGKVVQTELTTLIMNTPPSNEYRITNLLEAQKLTIHFQD